MADIPQVLFVCSLSKAHHVFVEALKQRGIAAISAIAVGDAEPVLRDGPLALVVCSSELLDGSFRDVLRILQQAKLKVPVLVISRTGDAGERREAKRLGAVDCMPRPLCLADAEAVIQVALREITSAGNRQLA
jgi:DNA-binding response OmpR family regulator